MSTNTIDIPKKVTTSTVSKMKQAGEKIAMITAYDYTMASLVDAAGIDLILVGDSAANVMAGYGSTLPITLDQMIYHAQCVTRGAQRAAPPCTRSGTVVKGTVEYRSPARFLPGEDMPRKSLDIRFTDYPFIRKKDHFLFPAPSEGVFGQSP